MARPRRIRMKRAVTHQPGEMRSKAGHRSSENARMPSRTDVFSSNISAHLTTLHSHLRC